MPSVVYIDPQSYNNLSLYDHGMLTMMRPGEIVLFGSSQWDCNMPNAELKRWFTYNGKKNYLCKGLSYLSTILRIALYISRHPEVKVVHIQWLRLWRVDIMFVRWLRSRGIKVVFTAHNLLPHDSGDTQRDKYSVYYKAVDCICVHTVATKSELITQFEVEPDKIEIIPHGIISTDIPEDVIRSRAGELRTLYGINPGDLVISSLGIQSFYKGIDNLIKVWSQDEKFNSDSRIKLMIVGKNSGVDYSPLKGLGNVIVVDERVSNEDFHAYLEISDVVLLPYRRISQSGVLFSAIARNKPVVVSNVGGLPDPLKVGCVGWNMGSPDEDNLRGVMSDIVANREDVKGLQCNNNEFQKVRDYYSWSSISKMLLNLYDRLME